VNAGPRTAAPFPKQKTDLHSLRLTLNYQWREKTTLRMSYWYERYRSDDFALDGVEFDTVPNVLALGANAHRYSVNTVMISVVYRPK